MSPIDPPRKSVNLPVPIGRATTISPRGPAGSDAKIEAQIRGQQGARRGLRAGATIIDAACNTYSRTEWSGTQDRRPPLGRSARIDI
jgi:hypothetical protein